MSCKRQQLVLNARAEALRDVGQQAGAHPRAQVARIAVRRIIVRRQFARGGVLDELHPGEGQERAHQAVAPFRADPREAGRRAAAQHAQQHRFDLIILVMCSHEIAPRALSLHVAEPRIARATRLGFCCIRPEVQLSQIEWKFVRCREVPNHQTD